MLHVTLCLLGNVKLIYSEPLISGKNILALRVTGSQKISFSLSIEEIYERQKASFLLCLYRTRCKKRLRLNIPAKSKTRSQRSCRGRSLSSPWLSHAMRIDSRARPRVLSLFLSRGRCTRELLRDGDWPTCCSMSCLKVNYR